MDEEEGWDKRQGAALWARYRAGPTPQAEPDAALLAGYAENRLGEAESARVESWLARHPEAIDAVLAARAASASGALPLGRPDEIRAAQQLIAAVQSGLQFARGVAWGSIAAGLIVACLLGYEAGVATGGHTAVAFDSAAREMGFGAGSEPLLASALGGGDAGEEL